MTFPLIPKSVVPRSQSPYSANLALSYYAAIDQGRNQMATDALIDGYEETMWIDADVEFHPNAVDHLRALSLPIVCGVYPQKRKRAVACHIVPGTPSDYASTIRRVSAGAGT